LGQVKGKMCSGLKLIRSGTNCQFCISLSIVDFCTLPGPSIVIYPVSAKNYMRLPLLRPKIKTSLCLMTRHAMKMCAEVEAQLHAYLTSLLDGGVWLASRPSRFTPGERIPDTKWIGFWMVPRARSEGCGEKANILPLTWIESRFFGCPASSLISIVIELSQCHSTWSLLN
jgi:hypothetical protein